MVILHLLGRGFSRHNAVTRITKSLAYSWKYDKKIPDIPGF
ncbi:hypothetical protein TERTU_4579 [Teredinibacter turnerae T7901]|uniref:Uncharacterized protein n=1 Tax=Teredinibacter turnerae (strain ATCC 39867 / T7901) TaxID=377629 RepID=C5BJT8_TERTT|nr:hypothetical protein TERTU_4579 [Teredinibacter turnerae T7901]